VIRNLLYELIDHPTHHFVGLYQSFDTAALQAMLSRTTTLLSRRGIAKWTVTSRNKVKRYLAASATN
jgi:hypothetical protein